MKYLKLSPSLIDYHILMKMNMRIISKTSIYILLDLLFLMQISRSNLHNYLIITAMCIISFYFHFISIPTLTVSIKIDETTHSCSINHSFFSYLLFVFKLEGQNVDNIFGNHDFPNHPQIVLKSQVAQLYSKIPFKHCNSKSFINSFFNVINGPG